MAYSDRAVPEISADSNSYSTPASTVDSRKKRKAEVPAEMRKRMDIAATAEMRNREEALEDLEFLTDPEKHWPESIRNLRIGRVCLSLNMLPKFVEQVLGDARQNKPSIKVHAVDSLADPAVAKILEGLIRNIEYTSNAGVCYDTALEYAVSMGWGYFRVALEYAEDESFKKHLVVKRIVNPFSVYFDPLATEADYSDADWCAVTETVSKEEFSRRWPTASIGSVETYRGDGQMTWVTNDDVRIAEYWVKEPVTKTLVKARLMSGQIIECFKEHIPPFSYVVKSRTVETHEVKGYVGSGSEVLEEIDWPGKYLPIIPVLGKEMFVDGERRLRGIVRFAKDAQRQHNYWNTMATELVALQPKSPYFVTPKMIEPYKAQWDNAHRVTYPYLYYDVDPNSPTAYPKREPPPQISEGFFKMLGFASQALRDTTGIYQPSLGDRQGDQSGRAIQALQREGDTGTFFFIDNLTRAITHLGRVLINLIPYVYDADQIVRVMGENGQGEFVRVNQEEFDPMSGVNSVLYDLTIGRYDIVVTVGPSYGTKRIEAVNSLLEFLKIFPPAAPVLADLVAKNADWESADEIRRRMEALLPPAINPAMRQINTPLPEQAPPQQVPQQMPAAAGPPNLMGVPQ